VERNIEYGIWRNDKTPEHRRQFINLRRKVTNLVRQAKRQYMYRFLNPSLPSKVLWKNLESIRVKDSVDTNVIYSPAKLGSYYESPALSKAMEIVMVVFVEKKK
jgi:hypothetical protein